jgi:hypothetical protein
MTVASNDLLVGPVTPGAGVTLIAIDFYFENETDLEVYKSGSNTPLTLTTDYTVSLPTSVGATDGSISLVVAADGTDRYSIYGKQPLVRSSDLQFRNDLRSPVINVELDRIWRAIQGIDTALDRVFKFSQTSDVPLPLDAETAASRQNQLIGFTADGTQLALVITPDGLNTLAGLTDEIAAIGTLETEIGALYAIRTDITALAAVASDVDALGGLASEILALAAIDTEIGQVAAVAGDVTTVAANIADVTNVSDNMASILAALAGALTGSDIGVTVQGYSASLAAFSGKTAPSGAVVGTTDTQTLTNKTLTSPAINVGSDAEGDLYYRTSGGVFTRLPRGTNGQVLSLASGVPAWQDASGGVPAWELVETLYDADVDGATSTVDSSDFVAGYDYMLNIDNIKSPVNLRSIIGDIDTVGGATFASIFNLQLASTIVAAQIRAVLQNPRAERQLGYEMEVKAVAVQSDTTGSNTDADLLDETSTVFSRDQLHGGSPFDPLRRFGSIRMSAGNFVNSGIGVIEVYRREYVPSLWNDIS